MLFLLLVAFLLFGVSSVMSSLWLTQWTEDPVLQNASLTNTSIYLQHRDLYLGVYGGFGVLQGMWLNSLHSYNNFIYYANWQQTQHTQPIQQHRKSTETLNLKTG